MATRQAITLILILLTAVVPTLAIAGDCHVGSFGRGHGGGYGGHTHQAKHQDNVQLFFFVGLPVRLEALTAVQPQPQYQQPAAAVAAAPAQALAPAPAAQPAAQPAAAAAASRSLALTRQFCGDCHAGGSADGGFSLDGMTPDSRLKALTRLIHPDESLRMPKGSAEQPSAEQRGAIQQELLGLR